ncbi:MAG TPA: hypothetical protein VGQ53_01475 [Chitinophagaceae bacterium]|jgi:hypothetical protein|nr:hypothetical protein [Chitinophagaceae bacterium]
MKKYLLFFSLIIGSGIHSQPSVKVFGFEQESSPGTVATNVKDENGNPIKKAAIQKHYFIYLTVKQKHRLIPNQVFINGKGFSVETNVVDKTPVVRVNNNIPDRPEQTILVPRTNNKVFELTIADPFPVEKTSTLQQLTTKNQVVIAYTWKEKKYFAVLKKLKKLDPALNE